MKKNIFTAAVLAALITFAPSAAFAAAKPAPEPFSENDAAEYVIAESSYVRALVRENDGRAFIEIGQGIKEDVSPKEFKRYKTKINKPIQVGHGAYISVFAGMIGNGGMTYVMLLRKGGGADVVDISKGVHNGFAFKAEPVAGLKNVVRFEHEGDTGGSDIRAIMSDGRKISIYELLNKQHLL